MGMCFKGMKVLIIFNARGGVQIAWFRFSTVLENFSRFLRRRKSSRKMAKSGGKSFELKYSFLL